MAVTIPNRDKYNKAKELESVVKVTQSDFQRRKQEKKANPYKFVERWRTFRGTCCCCGRKNVKIYYMKYMVCLPCWDWIKSWIYNKYGKNLKGKITEAISEFNKPVKCKFYEFCGNTMFRLDNKSHIKKIRICDKCYPIWKHGYDTGSKHRSGLKKIKGKKASEIYGNTEQV